MRPLHLLPLAIVLGTAAFLTSACSPQRTERSSTDGEDGHAKFAYGNVECLFGCSLDRPMMRGTDESIYARARDGQLPMLEVRSTDPTVLVSSSEVACCKQDRTSSSCRSAVGLRSCDAGEEGSLKIEVHAAAAGSAHLVLSRGGAEWDRVTVEVAEPTRLDLTCAHETRKGDMIVGGECAIGWSAFDAEGRRLQSSTGVRLTIAPREVAAFHHIISADSWAEDGDQSLFAPSLVGLGAGAAEITATAGHAASAMTLNVQAK